MVDMPLLVHAVAAQVPVEVMSPATVNVHVWPGRQRSPPVPQKHERALATVPSLLVHAVAEQVPAEATSPAAAKVHVLPTAQPFAAPVPQMHVAALVTVPSLLGHAVGAARKYL